MRVYHDGWVAIPESVRKRLQVTAGDLLWVSVDKHRLVLSPSPQPADAGDGADHRARDGNGRAGDGRHADGHASSDDGPLAAAASRRRTGGRAKAADGSRPAPRAKRGNAAKSDRPWGT